MVAQVTFYIYSLENPRKALITMTDCHQKTFTINDQNKNPMFCSWKNNFDFEFTDKVYRS